MNETTIAVIPQSIIVASGLFPQDDYVFGTRVTDGRGR